MVSTSDGVRGSPNTAVLFCVHSWMKDTLSALGVGENKDVIVFLSVFMGAQNSTHSQLVAEGGILLQMMGLSKGCN